MNTDNSRIVEYIAYLILVRSMLRNSNLILLNPNEERILNYLALDLFLDKKISTQEVSSLIPGMEIKCIEKGIVSLNQKGYIKITSTDISGMKSSEKIITLTELSKQYLSNMGRCVFHASPHILQD